MLAKECLAEFKLDCELRRLSQRTVKGYFNNCALCLTFLEKERKHHNISIDDEESFLINTIEADEYVDGDELALLLRKAIASLPEKQRLVFNMKYYDEMKYEEMSEILGTSVGALKASYHLAVKKIEQFFTDNN